MIGEHGDLAIRLGPRASLELNTVRVEPRVVAVKVIRMQKQPNATAALLADHRLLFRGARFGE